MREVVHGRERCGERGRRRRGAPALGKVEAGKVGSGSGREQRSRSTAASSSGTGDRAGHGEEDRGHGRRGEKKKGKKRRERKGSRDPERIGKGHACKLEGPVCEKLKREEGGCKKTGGGKGKRQGQD